MGLLDFLKRTELDEDEETLVALLKNGITKQKELLAASGMNPVKFNKVMRSLEEREIAKREPHGRENTVKLL
ncbi:hypothetical protein ACFLQ2_04840 [archaeon]